MTDPLLTDELRSVLMAHTFQAPDPAASIDAILAATVGTDSARPRSASLRRAVTAGPGAAGRAAGRAVGHWWDEHRVAVVGGLVAAAVVLLAIGGVRALSTGVSKSGSTAATSARGAALNGGAGSDYAVPAAGATAKFAAPAAGAAAGATAPAAASVGSASPAASAAGGGSHAAAGSGATGPQSRTTGGVYIDGLPPVTPTPGGSCRFGGLPTATLQVNGDTLQIRQAYCVDAAGDPTSSLVQVERHENAVAATFTLIDQPQHVLADTIAVNGNVVTVRVRQLASAPPNAAVAPNPGVQVGTVSDYRFSTTDGRTFRSLGSTLVAQPCQLADLKVSIDPAAGTAAAVRFINSGPQRCSLVGYPQLTARPGNPKVTYALAGRSGGVTTSQLAPTVLLDPGDTATSLVESEVVTGTDNHLCGNSTEVVVGLPAPQPQPGIAGVTLPVSVGRCAIQVHPVVAGFSGTTR